MLNNSKIRQLREKIKFFGQDHIFRFWNDLSIESKEKLINQIETINFELMFKLKQKYLSNQENKFFNGELEPAPIIPVPATELQFKQAKHARQIGEKLLIEGKVGILLVAGGQGTRLGFDGPKGTFVAAPLSGKSLFQLHADKIKALNLKYGTTLAWFIMTSKANHYETIKFFENHNFFGLSKDDVFFFTQAMIPALDKNGKFLLNKKDHIFCNPNGHGGTLYALRDEHCLEEMKQRGIEQIFYFQVDNVLINICDPYFIGYHSLASAEMSSKVVAKRDAYEKVGVIGKINGAISVIEYSDMPKDAMEALNPDGKLKYIGGSIAIHMIKREFVEQLTKVELSLPYHVAHKKIPFVNENGKIVETQKPNGYKFEMFIFDALPFTTNSITMEIIREDEFSPIKNTTGNDSPVTAKQDLMNYYGRMLKKAGFKVPFDKNNNLIGNLEISPMFALTAEDLKRKLDRNFQFNGKLFLE